MKHVAVVAVAGGDSLLFFRQHLLVLSLLFIVPGSVFAHSATEQSEDFSRKTVVERARMLSEQPYALPAQAPESLTNLDRWLEPAETLALISQPAGLDQLRVLPRR